MGHWNYRVVRKVVDDEVIFGIHESYYDNDGNLEGITENPISIYAEENLENLAKEMGYIVQALEADVIKYEEAPMMIVPPIEEGVPWEEAKKELGLDKDD